MREHGIPSKRRANAGWSLSVAQLQADLRACMKELEQEWKSVATFGVEPSPAQHRQGDPARRITRSGRARSVMRLGKWRWLPFLFKSFHTYGPRADEF